MSRKEITENKREPSPALTFKYNYLLQSHTINSLSKWRPRLIHQFTDCLRNWFHFAISLWSLFWLQKNSRKIILLPQRKFDLNWMFDLLLWRSVNIGAKLKKRCSFMTGMYFFFYLIYPLWPLDAGVLAQIWTRHSNGLKKRSICWNFQKNLSKIEKTLANVL